MAIDQWTRRTQDATYATATHHGEGWTSRDLDFVSAFAGDVSDAELARALGRTLFAIQSIRHAIDAGRATGSTRRVATTPRVRLYDPRDFEWSD